MMLIGIQSWLLQPKVWRFVSFVSSVVGLLCYALSSSFNHLFGTWSWWKILLYILFSFIICLTVLFAKPWQRFTSLRLEAHAAFLVLMVTSVYSFFVDKVINGRPDAYSLVSCAAFAIMSLGLSRLSHFGFEVDLLYFFSGLLTVQFLKIKLWLVIVGGSFNYSLIILRSRLDALLLHGDFALQAIDQDVENGSLSPRTNSNASQVDSFQVIVTDTGDTNPQADVPLGNEDLGFLGTQEGSHSQQGRDESDSDELMMMKVGELVQKQERVSSLMELVSGESSGKRAARFQWVIDSCTAIEKERMGKILIARFMAGIEALKKKNGSSVIGMMSKHVNRCMNVFNDEHPIPVPQRDDNLLLDALQSDDDDNIVRDLRETARSMVMAGFEEECCGAYCSWRREFLNESLSAFGLRVQELNMEDIDKMEKIQILIKALNIATRILFPNERRLCDWVFGMSISSDFAFAKVCTELATRLLSTANALANFIPEKLEELMYEFELVFSDEHSKSLKKDARRVCKSSVISRDLENVLTCRCCGLLPITHEVINYFRDNSLQTESSLKLALDGILSPSMQVARVTRLFERSLKANSKNYKNPTLGYVFILNNRSYIDRAVDQFGWGSMGYRWLKKNKRKIQKYLELYQRSSWNKMLNFLKLDINEAEPNVAAELMKDKLCSFNEHFDDICNDQSTWSVYDYQLRKQIIKSNESILLPAYGNFIGRLQDFLGNQAYEYIKYGMIDVQDRLNNLFLVRD